MAGDDDDNSKHPDERFWLDIEFAVVSDKEKDDEDEQRINQCFQFAARLRICLSLSLLDIGRKRVTRCATEI